MPYTLERSWKKRKRKPRRIRNFSLSCSSFSNLPHFRRAGESYIRYCFVFPFEFDFLFFRRSDAASLRRGSRSSGRSEAGLNRAFKWYGFHFLNRLLHLLIHLFRFFIRDGCDLYLRSLDLLERNCDRNVVLDRGSFFLLPFSFHKNMNLLHWICYLIDFTAKERNFLLKIELSYGYMYSSISLSLCRLNCSLCKS